MWLRPELAAIIDRLATNATGPIELDALADELGAMPVSSEEIGLMIDELGRRGFVVGDPEAPPASAILGRVIGTARDLRQELGRTPSPREIADRSGLSLARVRLGLFFARMLAR
jgi:hypothetical protein